MCAWDNQALKNDIKFGFIFIYVPTIKIHLQSAPL